ncbi:MAG: hypothetical protein H7039_03120, partial [Bryobacteraceae bacterium]|nr:hypothetical protein [Bryobacteraceae bacterium]
FRWVFGLDPPAQPYELTFESVPDTGVSEAASQVRRKREKDSLENVKVLRDSLRTVRTLHEWLFRDHDGYGAVGTAGRLWNGPRETPELDTY